MGANYIGEPNDYVPLLKLHQSRGRHCHFNQDFRGLLVKYDFTTQCTVWANPIKLAENVILRNCNICLRVCHDHLMDVTGNTWVTLT